MGKVISTATMSLDGFIAFEDNTVGALFDWYGSGDVAMQTATPGLSFSVTPESAEYLRRVMDATGALVVGRTLFDFTDGWGGRHPVDRPVVVVTHAVPTDWVDRYPQAPFTFVTNGIEAAVAKAQELAGDRIVDVAAGTIARQCLELGLLDEISVDIAPVVMGEGRPYFGPLGIDPVVLGNPTTVIQGDRVLHLVYPVRR